MACGDVLSLEDLQTAKKHQIFEAEVITGKVGGVAGGAAIDYATNQVTGQVQKTMPAIMRDIGFEPASFDFTSGGTLTTSDRNKAVLWPLSGGGDGAWYYWEGALPKVIPASSTPESTGGVVDGSWRPVGDITLRDDLASPGGAGLVGFLQAGTGSVLRTTQDKAREWVSVSDFIEEGDTDANAAIMKALSSHGHIRFTPGNYLITSTITKLLTFDLHFEFAAGVKILVSPLITGPAFDFDGGGAYRFTSVGGEVDVSNILNDIQNKGTVFLLSNLSSAWSVSGMRFIAGSSFLDGFGDTGIAYINCASGEIRNNYFKGFADTGIYATGGNNPLDVDNGQPVSIIGNEFYRCSVGVAIKRQHSDSVVLSNTFTECQNGVAALTTGELPEPGKGVKVIGNTFKRSIATALNIRGGKGQFTAIGNTIEDWGYDLAGAPVAGTKSAIKIEGSLGSVVSSNHIRMQTYPDASNIAVVLENETVDAIEYKHGGNNITGNIISNCLQGIREAVLGSAPNYASDNVFVGVTNPLIKVNPDTIFRADYSAQNVTLGAIIVPAGATSALIEVPFAWASPSMVVWVTATSSAGFSPDIIYSCRAVAGKLQFLVKNNKATSIDLATCPLAINATLS